MSQSSGRSWLLSAGCGVGPWMVGRETERQDRREVGRTSESLAAGKNKNKKRGGSVEYSSVVHAPAEAAQCMTRYCTRCPIQQYPILRY